MIETGGTTPTKKRKKIYEQITNPSLNHVGADNYNGAQDIQIVAESSCCVKLPTLIYRRETPGKVNRS